MSYYTDLAFELRLRGLSEDRVRATLEEVASHAEAAATDPKTEFGEPQLYAEQFEKKRSRTLGVKIVTVGVVIGVVVAALQLVIEASFGVDARFGPVALFLCLAVVIVAISLGVGFVTDRRLPRGFSAGRDQKRRVA